MLNAAATGDETVLLKAFTLEAIKEKTPADVMKGPLVNTSGKSINMFHRYITLSISFAISLKILVMYEDK